jgi:hypothetical protein
VSPDEIRMALQQQVLPTVNEKASLLFLERVRQIPGVVQVEAYGGETIGEQSFRVYLRADDVEAEYGVYHLKAKIYTLFPEARLSVSVFEEADLVRLGMGHCPDAS